MTTTLTEFKQTGLICALRSCQLFSGLTLENLRRFAAITPAKFREQGLIEVDGLRKNLGE